MCKAEEHSRQCHGRLEAGPMSQRTAEAEENAELIG